jgi:hypothetical protein
MFLFVASEMTRVRRWKRKQVSKLLEKDGQRHQSCHLIYKQSRNSYNVRGGRLRDYGCHGNETRKSRWRAKSV